MRKSKLNQIDNYLRFTPAHFWSATDNARYHLPPRNCFVRGVIGRERIENACENGMCIIGCSLRVCMFFFFFLVCLLISRAIGPVCSIFLIVERPIPPNDTSYASRSSHRDVRVTRHSRRSFLRRMTRRKRVSARCP